VKQLPKVFVVADNPAVLSSIEALLTAQSYDVECFTSAHKFIAQNLPTQVGCLVIDFSTLGIGGSELIRHLHDTCSLLSVVIISGLIDATVVYRHEKGQVPLLATPFEVWILTRMIEDAIAGSLKRDRALAHAASPQVDWLRRYALTKEKLLKLSPRQREVMSSLLAGDSLKEIAQKLGLSKHTVGDHVKRIYNHFSVTSRAELLAQFISGEQP
jgi:two-component system, LuxR family, response regulator FixJ